jgi:hypothetical protein
MTAYRPGQIQYGIATWGSGFISGPSIINDSEEKLMLKVTRISHVKVVLDWLTKAMANCNVPKVESLLDKPIMIKIIYAEFLFTGEGLNKRCLRTNH